MELLGRLRRAVNKLTFLLSLKKFLTTSTWLIASSIARAPAAITGTRRLGRRAYSFNDRPGLRACVEVVIVNDDDHHHSHFSNDEGYNDDRWEGSSGTTSPYPNPLRRATSYPMHEDVDNQADMFIDNFYRHLLYEKQVSLNLRYCHNTSSSKSSTEDSIVSPLSSASSYQIVSPT